MSAYKLRHKNYMHMLAVLPKLTLFWIKLCKVYPLMRFLRITAKPLNSQQFAYLFNAKKKWEMQWKNMAKNYPGKILAASENRAVYLACVCGGRHSQAFSTHKLGAISFRILYIFFSASLAQIMCTLFACDPKPHPPKILSAKGCRAHSLVPWFHGSMYPLLAKGPVG